MRGVADALPVLLLQVLNVRPHVRGIDRRILIIRIGLAAGADGEANAAILVHKTFHVVAPFRATGLAHGGDVEIDPVAFAVEKDVVVLSRIAAGAAAPGFIAPDDLVHKVLPAEDFIQQQTELRAHAVVDMQV